MAQIQKGTTYSTGNATVTIENLNQLVDNSSLLPGAISEQAPLVGNAAPATDQALLLVSGQLKKATIVQALGGVTPSELLNANNNLSDLASINAAKTNLALNNVENKSSATIRSEITSANVTTALGYIPVTPSNLSAQIDTRIATTQIAGFVSTSQLSSLATTTQVAALSSSALSTFIETNKLGVPNGVATLDGFGKLSSNQVAALNSTSQLSLLGTQALAAIGAQPILTLPLSVAQGGTGQSSSTGSGAVVLANSATLNSSTLNSPVLATPQLGTPTSGNLVNCTNLPAGSITGTLAVANGGTGVTTSTGTGSVVLSASPVLVTPTLGTPASGNLSNCTNIPASGITGTLPVLNGGTGTTTSTGTGNVVLSTSPTLVAPALGTPVSGNLQNCTGLPVGGITGVSGITGTGNLVLSNSPTLVAPALGTPSSGNLSNCTGLPVNSLSGILPVAQGGTGVTTSTGTGSVVLSNSPALVTPTLGTPASGNLSNCTGLPVSGISGVLPTAQGGTGTTTAFGSGSVILAKSSPAPSSGQIMTWNSTSSQFEFKDVFTYSSSVSLSNQNEIKFSLPVINIPLTPRKITILFDKVRLSSEDLVVRLENIFSISTGYSGGYSYTGQNSLGSFYSAAQYTGGLLLTSSPNETNLTKSGVVTIILVGNGSYIMSGSLSAFNPLSSSSASTVTSHCSVTTGMITSVIIRSVNGSSMFIGGSLNIFWE